MTIQATPRTSHLMTALVIAGLIIAALLWAAAYLRPEPRVPRRTTVIMLEPGNLSNQGLLRRVP